MAKINYRIDAFDLTSNQSGAIYETIIRDDLGDEKPETIKAEAIAETAVLELFGHEMSEEVIKVLSIPLNH